MKAMREALKTSREFTEHSRGRFGIGVSHIAGDRNGNGSGGSSSSSVVAGTASSARERARAEVQEAQRLMARVRQRVGKQTPRGMTLPARLPPYNA